MAMTAAAAAIFLKWYPDFSFFACMDVVGFFLSDIGVFNCYDNTNIYMLPDILLDN